MTKAGNRGRELKQELARILDILKNRLQPQKVILFGSLAVDRVEQNSDIDLLIICDSPDPIFERTRKVESLLDRRRAADLVVLTPREVQMLLEMGNRYLRQILSRGKVLYEHPV